MQTILGFLTDTFGRIGAQFLSISFNDVIDIALLAVVLYYVYRFVRERRAGKLALGLGILVVLYALTTIFEMYAMSFLLQNVFQVGLLALIILFQPELRAALEKVGGDPLRSIRSLTEPKEVAEATRAIDNICIAASDMARDRTGALIVIERTTKLGDIMKTGVQLDAVISQSLIKNIFFNKAALHDGAMIIRDNRIAAAGCFLPLTQNTQISKDKGTRHRAGVGVSEVSDAVVIIVSEETGEISLALGGSLLGGQNYTTLRQQLTQLTSQIDLLQRSQNTAATQLDGLLKERSGALYDLLDALDTAQYSDVDESTDAYLLAQNKLWITTGDTAGFADQIALLAQQAQTVQAQLGNPTQITAPTTGYFVRAASSGRLNAGAADILAQSPEQLKAYLDSDPEMPLDGCVGKLVAGFSWQYAGVCSAKQAEKLLGSDGKPLRTAVEISFPGQSDAALRATVSEVTIDAEKDVARFVLQCNSINGDVLCLNHARARISTGESTGLRVPAAAVHYLKEDGTEAETQGENYIPGVYVKYGNIARFCKIDPVDNDHPLVTDGDYILVLPKGTDGSVSQVRLYDEIIVSGQNLYDGKLL